jgi:hypothetical protein
MSASRALLAAGAIALAFFAIPALLPGRDTVVLFALLIGFGIAAAVIFLIAIMISTLIFAVFAAIHAGLGRETSPGRALAQIFKMSIGVSLALGILAAVIAPGIFLVPSMEMVGEEASFEGGGFREWLFEKLTLTGQTGRLEPDGKPAHYYVSFQRGDASMKYDSSRPAAEAVAMFRAFCVRKRLTPSGEDGTAEPGALSMKCLPPGETFKDTLESSYLYITATPAGTGSHVQVGEINMGKY